MARILVTDDEEAIRTLMAAVLREQGHEVIEARAAREAIQQHRDLPADLIITDLVMKEMDGTELLRRIRSFSPDTPVIGVSGAHHGQMYLNMAKLIGADCVLAKPFPMATLVKAVNDVLAKRRDVMQASSE